MDPRIREALGARPAPRWGVGNDGDLLWGAQTQGEPSSGFLKGPTAAVLAGASCLLMNVAASALTCSDSPSFDSLCSHLGKSRPWAVAASRPALR